MRRFVVLFAFLVPALLVSRVSRVSAQDPAENPGSYDEASHAAGEGEADIEGEHGAAHETELDHLRIRGIGDLFSVPAGLPEEIHEERAHLRNQLLAAIVNFSLLLALLFWKVRPMIRTNLVDRRATIAKDIEEAARLKAEAEAKHAEYKKRLAALDTELAEIRDEMARAGKAEADRIVGEAQAKAERARKETEFLIEQRVKSLRDELSTEVVLAAITAAEKLLGEKTTAEDQTRLSRGYVAKLGEVAATGTGGRA